MRAAVLRSPHHPLTIEDLTLDAPRAGEVRVRIEATGVCHSDLHYARGDLPSRVPIVLGHEGAGIVLEVGPGVEDLAPGDKVVLTWRPRCGQCEYCSSGRPGLCVEGRVHAESNGLLRGGTRLRAGEEEVHHLMGLSCFAEECVVSQESVLRVPADVPSDIAAIVGCAVVTGMGVVLNRMPGAGGQAVLVIGAGGVGLSAIIGAVLVGAHPIIAVDLSTEKLDKARELGATHVIDARREDVAREVLAITGSGAQWVVDAIGSQATVTQAMASLRPGGTTFMVGLGGPADQVSVPLNNLVQAEKSLQGSLYGSSNIGVQLPRILDLYRAGRIPLDRLRGPTYRLDDVNEALAGLSGGTVGRAVISMI
ncbi:MAG: Zn-dependent alcohol dehydrogenase [Aeromicrobium sp.]|nr:Zn-dependent alcohol dehydrogenase [Aeromicrobium sp.]